MILISWIIFITFNIKRERGREGEKEGEEEGNSVLRPPLTYPWFIRVCHSLQPMDLRHRNPMDLLYGKPMDLRHYERELSDSSDEDRFFFFNGSLSGL